MPELHLSLFLPCGRAQWCWCQVCPVAYLCQKPAFNSPLMGMCSSVFRHRSFCRDGLVSATPRNVNRVSASSDLAEVFCLLTWTEQTLHSSPLSTKVFRLPSEPVIINQIQWVIFASPSLSVCGLSGGDHSKLAARPQASKFPSCVSSLWLSKVLRICYAREGGGLYLCAMWCGIPTE